MTAPRPRKISLPHFADNFPLPAHNHFMMHSGGGPSNAKPESLYREASTAKSMRPTGSSDLRKTSTGHTNSGFAVKQQSSATGTGIRANVVKRVKFVLEIGPKLLWMDDSAK
jgi:hypothetical protein